MSQPQRRPAGTMSTERRYGIAISVALILGGAYWALTGLTTGETTSQQSYPVQGSSLNLETRSTDVEVRSGDVKEVKVERRFERNLFGSDPSEEYENGTLAIRGSSCGFLSVGCKTEIVVTIPKDLPVTVESHSGDVEVAGLPAGGKVTTTSGSIDVRDVGGSLTLESTSGSVDAKDLTAATVTANSVSGSTDLEFRSAPQSVQAEATSGDVSITVPGAEVYKVETDATSGDESVTVKTDPAASRTIKARTTSGDVTIEGE